MKLLVLVHDYLPLHLAGTELHAHQMASLMVQRGHDVTALFTERDLSREEGSLRRDTLDGVKLIEMVHQREYADVAETWLQDLSLRVFREQLAELAPDCVHVQHLAFWGSRCLDAIADAGIPCVLTLHDYHLICDNAVLLRDDGELCTEGPSGDCTHCVRRHPMLPERHGATQLSDDLWQRAARERHALHKQSLSRVERVICPSRFLAERFIEAGMLREEQVVVMKAGYPGPRREARLSDASQPLRVGYVGGVYPSKGVHVLVEAFEHLRDVSAQLSIHGILDWFPDYVAELRSKAEGLPIDFVGRFEPDQLDIVLAGLDCLVIPSIWYENMPITIQEAYRNGLPAIVTDLGGMAEAVPKNRGGLRFPRGDARALAECIQQLANDRQLAQSLAAAAPAPPTPEVIAEELQGLYATLRKN